MLRIWWPIVVILVTLGAPLRLDAAQGSSESAVEGRAQSIERLLTAPCCYKGTLEDHASAVASEMRKEIRTMLRAGRSKEQILDHYRRRYGQAILMEPPKGGLSGFILYGIPFGLAVIGLVVMTALVARRRKAESTTAEGGSAAPAALPPELEARIDALVAGEEPAAR